MVALISALRPGKSSTLTIGMILLPVPNYSPAAAHGYNDAARGFAVTWIGLGLQGRPVASIAGVVPT
jgi:hypothetical protein